LWLELGTDICFANVRPVVGEKILFSENEINGADQTHRSVDKVSVKGLFHKEDGEEREDHHGDNFLDDLQLRQ